MENSPGKKVYYNPPQLRSALVDANEEYHVLGRGSGKSSGILAYKTRRNALELPKSLGLNVARNYQQALTQTLPSLISGWHKLGWQRDLHYFVGRRPPKSWKWPQPIEPPQNYQYAVSFFNGSVLQLVSQDRPGSANGINSDYIIGDEVKYLNYNKYLDEVLPTMRANRTERRKDGVQFQDLPFHHSICFTTSMPTAADAKWILDKREEMDQDKINLMLGIQAEIMKLRGNGGILDVNTLAKMAGYENQLKKMRFGTVYYQEASSFENIHVLGIEYIKRMRRIMPDFIFNTEILNMRPDSIEGGFYPLLDVDIHGYWDSYDNSYLESLDYNLDKLAQPDSRQDADCIKTEPLRLAPDYGGGKITCLTVAQHLRSLNEYRFLKCIYSMEAPMLDNAIKQFIQYYAHHPHKVINFIPDNEYGNSRVPNSTLTYNQDAMKQLRAAGWVVREVATGRVPGYYDRYLLWQKLLQQADPRAPRIRINRNNCKELLISMAQAPIRQNSRGQLEKDKTSERRLSVKPTDATHFSDTGDLHAVSVGMPLITEHVAFDDVLVG